jgi:enoyl-CoA hydratase/carnithine racemase
MGIMSDRVTISIDERGIADVRLNRADKRNALDGAMFAALRDAGEGLKSEPRARVVVLSGEGASFCAGLDFSSFQSMAGGGDAGGDGAARAGVDAPSNLTPGGITHLGQQVAWVWQELPVPVIAAVHGHALGGGIQIALGADIRFVHPDTKLSVREVHWGLVPDMTGTLFLSRLVGPDVAKELTFTARMISGTEAGELGLATHVTETPRDDAFALAAEIAGRSPEAVRGAKALFNRLANAEAAEQFAEERRVIGSLIGSPNQVEAITANFENRAPVFTDPT